MWPRFLLVVLTLMAFQANAGAQTREALPQRWSDPLPDFAVSSRDGRAVPLPQIGLPLPQIGLPPIERPHGPRRQWPSRYQSWPYVVVVPEFMVPAAPVAVAAAPPPLIAAKGNLVLDVQPAEAQVFVDGFYRGVVEEFAPGRGGVFLDAGPHTIELAAAGRQGLRFDVRILPNEPLVFRRAMTVIDANPAPTTPPAAKTPTTIYMIPGCYVGNVPPKDAHLPATCDATRTEVFTF